MTPWSRERGDGANGKAVRGLGGGGRYGGESRESTERWGLGCAFGFFAALFAGQLGRVITVGFGGIAAD